MDTVVDPIASGIAILIAIIALGLAAFGVFRQIF